MEATGLEGVINGVRDLTTVKRVYGDPYEKNGLTVIPAATLQGGGGGGGGRQGDESSGSGGGFGVRARPSGAWIIEGDKVTWKPAVDANKVVLGGQLVTLIALLIAARVIDRRLERKEHARRSRLRSRVEMLGRLVAAASRRG